VETMVIEAAWGGAVPVAAAAIDALQGDAPACAAASFVAAGMAHSGLEDLD
jgi:hypothetical protein